MVIIVYLAENMAKKKTHEDISIHLKSIYEKKVVDTGTGRRAKFQVQL